MTLSRRRPENNTEDNRKSGQIEILHQGMEVGVGKNKSELFIYVQSLTRASGQSPVCLLATLLGHGGGGGRGWSE